MPWFGGSAETAWCSWAEELTGTPSVILSGASNTCWGLGAAAASWTRAQASSNSSLGGQSRALDRAAAIAVLREAAHGRAGLLGRPNCARRACCKQAQACRGCSSKRRGLVSQQACTCLGSCASNVNGTVVSLKWPCRAVWRRRRILQVHSAGPPSWARLAHETVSDLQPPTHMQSTPELVPLEAIHSFIALTPLLPPPQSPAPAWPAPASPPCRQWPPAPPAPPRAPRPAKPGPPRAQPPPSLARLPAQ